MSEYSLAEYAIIAIGTPAIGGGIGYLLHRFRHKTRVGRIENVLDDIEEHGLQARFVPDEQGDISYRTSLDDLHDLGIDVTLAEDANTRSER